MNHCNIESWHYFTAPTMTSPGLSEKGSAQDYLYCQTVKVPYYTVFHQFHTAVRAPTTLHNALPQTTRSHITKKAAAVAFAHIAKWPVRPCSPYRYLGITITVFFKNRRSLGGLFPFILMGTFSSSSPTSPAYVSEECMCIASARVRDIITRV